MRMSAPGAAVRLAVLAVAVVPEHELLEDEEAHDAGQQHHAGPRGAQIVEHLGQQRQQRHAEQHADGIADEMRDQPHPRLRLEQQKPRRQEQAAKAPDDAQADGRGEQMHPEIIR